MWPSHAGPMACIFLRIRLRCAMRASCSANRSSSDARRIRLPRWKRRIARARTSWCSGRSIDPISKSAYGPAAGVDALREACEASDIPVYALGGITPDRIEELSECETAGIAAIGSVFAAPSPAGATRALCKRSPIICNDTNRRPLPGSVKDRRMLRLSSGLRLARCNTRFSRRGTHSSGLRRINHIRAIRDGCGTPLPNT